MTTTEIADAIRWIETQPTITAARYTEGRPAIEVHRNGDLMPCALVPVAGQEPVREAAERLLEWVVATPTAELVLESLRLEALADSMTA